jgi:hypothetical protein
LHRLQVSIPSGSSHQYHLSRPFCFSHMLSSVLCGPVVVPMLLPIMLSFNVKLISLFFNLGAYL